MAPPTPAKLVAAVVAVADDHFYSSVLWNIALDAGEQSGRRQAAIQQEAPSDNGRRSCLQRLAQVSDGRSRTGSAIKLWIQYLRGRCSTCGSMARTTAMALGGRRFCEGLLRCRSEIAELGESCVARRSAPGPSTYDPPTTMRSLASACCASSRDSSRHTRHRVTGAHSDPRDASLASSQRRHGRCCRPLTAGRPVLDRCLTRKETLSS
jgi:hypothetical protein